MSKDESHKANMAEPKPYDEKFFSTQTITQEPASIVLKHLFEIIPMPKTAIDVGCGSGGWTAALKEYCTDGVLGIDGDYVPRDTLLIDQEEFFPADLEELVFPRINKRFDIAVSLEVAEHLSVKRADSFVQDLTDLADTILFSAAIPFQTGTNHINCQWQSYWEAKFLERGYQADTRLREKIWHNQRIGRAYRQNVLLFTKTDSPQPKLGIDVVHPEMYVRLIPRVQESTITAMEQFFQTTLNADTKPIFQAFRQKMGTNS